MAESSTPALDFFNMFRLESLDGTVLRAPTLGKSVTGNLPADADAQARGELSVSALPANGDQVIAPDDSPLSSRPAGVAGTRVAEIPKQPWFKWVLVAAVVAGAWYLSKGE